MKKIIPGNRKDLEILVDDDWYEDANEIMWTASGAGNTKYATAYMGKARENQCYYLHRIIIGALKGERVDHINGNGLDNRRSNLRVCDASQNGRNSLKRKKTSTSKYKGVFFNPFYKKWQSTLWIGEIKRSKHLGYFKNEIDAAKAWDAAATKYHGSFARLNFPT